jgi:hypothetical protein
VVDQEGLDKMMTLDGFEIVNSTELELDGRGFKLLTRNLRKWWHIS